MLGVVNPLTDLAAARRQRRVTDEVEHRPWPLPERPWFMAQSWERLLFAHWPVPLETIRPVVPPDLPIDTRDGEAWVGVTPFRVRGFRLRNSPPIPPIATFPEVNVRTYVTLEDKPGIYFLSLDADSRLAVEAARRLYRLPYFRARMRVESNGSVDYTSRRVDSSGPAAELACRYQPLGRPYQAEPDSLDYFLTERYCLYTLDDHRRVNRGEIHHPPWALRRARGTFRVNGMGQPFGLRLTGEPLLHLSERQDVVMWRIGPLDA